MNHFGIYWLAFLATVVTLIVTYYAGFQAAQRKWCHKRDDKGRFVR